MAFSCWPISSKKIETLVVKTEAVETDLRHPNSDVLIIDCGSGACKAGFAGETQQNISIPTVLGRPKEGAAMGFRSDTDTYVGSEAQEKRVVLNLSVPIERGVITNWDDMEIYFDYIFNEGLQVDPSLFNIFLTEMLFNPSKNREKLLELMLERFYFKSFFLTPAPPLALYSYGFHTGVVVDSGEGQTHIVPVYQGFSMPHSARYIPLGGKDLNNMLEIILSQSSKTKFHFQTTDNKEFLRDIKEELCYVAFDYQEEFTTPTQKTISYRLPEGNYVKLSNELFRCPEALFEPTMLDVRTGGIHENLYRAIQLSDLSIRHLLYDHIVLSGGNTLFSGLQHRLTKEMRFMSEPEATIRIHAKSDRKNSVFNGASIFASMPNFKDMMITYEEYFENGPSLVHKKCF